MVSEAQSRRPVELLMAEWKILHSLLRRQATHPFPSNEVIKASITQTETDLRRFEEEIQLQNSSCLEDEKQLLEKSIAGYKSLLAPIRQLPPEVLQQIFFFVCDENYIGEVTANIPGVTLAQVCIFWNDLVKSCPQLWSTVHFQPWVPNHEAIPASDPSDKAFLDCRWQRPMLEYLLEQSGSRPLSIRISMTVDPAREFLQTPYWTPEDPSLQCVKLLARQSYRWLSVTIRLSPFILRAFRCAIKSVQGNLPILEYLNFGTDFCIAGGDHQPADALKIDAFQCAPKLSSVELWHETSPAFITLPWNQLQSLVLAGPSYRYAPLSLTPQLKSLQIFGHDDFFEDENKEETINISADVEDFLLGICELDELDVLADLTFPKLISLSLVYPKQDQEQQALMIPHLAQITSFLSRSSCTLTSLEWITLPSPLGLFMSLLAAVPSLTVLDVAEIYDEVGDQLICNELFKALHCSRFLPSLNTLGLCAIRGQFPIESFTDALQARWLMSRDATNSLEVMLERPENCFSEADIVPLRHLVKAGMKIEITDKSGIVLC